MHTSLSPRPAQRTLRRGVTTSAVGVTMAFLVAGPADAAEDHQVVEVTRGDTLTEIAADHGLDPTSGWRRIAAATPDLGDPNTIVPGQQVRVPTPATPDGAVSESDGAAADGAGSDGAGPAEGAGAPQPDTVQVEAGDTLADIAAEHGVGEWRRVFDANPHVADPNTLAIGEQLRIPAPGEPLDRRPLPRPEPPPPSDGAAVQQQGNASPPSTASEDPHAQAGSPSSRTDVPEQSQASPGGGVWDRLAQCESNGDWSANTGNGFYGGLQFTPSSWRAVGGQGLPHQASKAEQIARAQQLQQLQGWGAWPACSRKLGLR